MVLDTFNPSTRNAKDDRSQSLMPALSKEQVQRDTSLGSKEEQKTGKVVITNPRKQQNLTASFMLFLALELRTEDMG